MRAGPKCSRFQAIVEATGQELQQLRSHAETWQRERLQLGSEIERSRLK